MVNRLEQLQADFRETRKQTRIIEKLRERRWDQYRRDLQHREQAATTELAQQLHMLAQAAEPVVAAQAHAPRGPAADHREVAEPWSDGGAPTGAEWT
jgi:hypothetical protein